MKFSPSALREPHLMGQASSLLAKVAERNSLSGQKKINGFSWDKFNRNRSNNNSYQGEVLPEEETILIQRTIRSGQSIRFHGNVVIMGDVNPGGEVVAGGDIIVMGHLRGVAHAGAMGSEKAVVAAFRLQPTQLSIANHITRSPDGEQVTPEQPEVARIQNGVVVIEKYHPNSNRHLNLLY